LPNYEIINQINKLYNNEHIILLYTARGATTGIDWRKITEDQMRQWGLKYHQLYFGKPTADVYIDDKAINLSEWKNNHFSFK
jgi:CMP-N,N'-diacetyllegionaminic acid synthase